MEYSTALATGATSGLGYAAARLLAKGYREVIVTGRSLAQVKQSAAQLAAEANKQFFMPLELDLNDPTNVDSAVATLLKQGSTGRFPAAQCKAGPLSAGRRLGLRREVALIKTQHCVVEKR